MTHQFAPSAVAGDRSVAVRIEDVDLFYGTNHVLKSVNLTIQPGEFFAFLGPSGCGKTTLLRLIAGFNTARRGRVIVGNEDVAPLPPHKRDVGMVFQSYALWPHMTVRRNVAFGLEERRVPRAEVERRVDAALDLVGLRHLADRRPSQLSGGQQQRVALARTIVVQPKVLLLDEPLSNLDAKLRVQMRQELLALQRRLGLTTIFVTHDQEEANTICDRIAVMEDGVVQQVGSPQELYDHPANLFVAGFLGTANVLEGEVRQPAGGAGAVFAVAGTDALVPLAPGIDPGTTGKLMFRPQNLAIRADGAEPDPASVVLTGSVRHREFLGANIRYAVDLGTQVVQVDSAHQTGEPMIPPETRVGLTLAADKVRFLRR